MKKLSVVVATRNEEKNIGDCLESVVKIASEIVVVDEFSTDKTVEIAQKYGARVYKEPHHPIFHVTKQKALDYASGEWILQLDADEKVPDELAAEIKEVIMMDNDERRKRRAGVIKQNPLFQRHQNIIEQRDGPIGSNTGEIVAYFIPRVNLFLGKVLIHAGVYPDGVIRLVKNGKANFPQKSVHEQIIIDGEISWLENNLEHHDSPTLKRYLSRLNRYTDLHAQELAKKKVGKNVFNLLLYICFKPAIVFLKLYIRHRGYLDGPRGFLWSFFSALHFPIAYFKYWFM